MLSNKNFKDVVIIGGGFYGVAIAIYLAKQRGLKNIVILEQEVELLTRASSKNQARVHNGYHYPRSFTTAYRSRINLPKFIQDWPYAIKKDFKKLYAIARQNSNISAKQFYRFCLNTGASIKPANKTVKKLFNQNLIEEVYEVEEYAFDSKKILEIMLAELNQLSIRVLYQTKANGIKKNIDGTNRVSINHNMNSIDYIDSNYVFNCTYSGLNQFIKNFHNTNFQLKHEITEIALIKPPSIIEDIGITVMDGPFFSMMPFPSKNLHSLTHVRYTPHLQWYEHQSIDPYGELKAFPLTTRIDRMMRDASRYVPIIQQSTYIESIFEIKSLLVKNEIDDGRPILFKKHLEMLGCYSILGGKIDNIYDVLEKLDNEYF